MKKEGTFQHCTNCSSNPICCSNFNQIDAPVLNKEELEKIKQFVGNEEFYNILEENLYSLKLKGDNCIFYRDNKCIIYDSRPVDCKLYPFDIIKNEQRYYLIMYLLDCINYQKLENENPSIEPMINEIIPWIDGFTEERNFTKMKKKKYKIVKEIKLQ